MKVDTFPVDLVMKNVSDEFQHQECYECGALMTSSLTPYLLSDMIMVYSDEMTDMDKVVTLDQKSVVSSCRIVGAVGPDKSVLVKDDVKYSFSGDTLSVLSAPFVFEGRKLLIMKGEVKETIKSEIRV